MASSGYGTEVDSELNSLSINTAAEVLTFRSLPRRLGDMTTVTDAIAVTKSKQWISRKRVRSDALRLLNEGAL